MKRNKNLEMILVTIVVLALIAAVLYYRLNAC